MHAAIESKDVESIKRLLLSEVDVNAEDEKCCSSLYNATLKGSEEIVNLLLEHKDIRVDIGCSNRNKTPLHIAAQYGFVNIAKALIIKGASVSSETKGGQTPLFFAVSNKSIEMISLLVKEKADVDHVDKYGENPLFLAVSNEHALN